MLKMGDVLNYAYQMKTALKSNVIAYLVIDWILINDHAQILTSVKVMRGSANSAALTLWDHIIVIVEVVTCCHMI
jgi:hypothetical protein